MVRSKTQHWAGGKESMFETVFTIVFGAICIVGLCIEDKLIVFENKLFEKIKNYHEKR